ncbi:MAG: PaaI family thioesterase [Lachnospiraceae bacterium]|nr:PaaI family thioesterase [Lachnospiraceae bacterium]
MEDEAVRVEVVGAKESGLTAEEIAKIQRKLIKGVAIRQQDGSHTYNSALELELCRFGVGEKKFTEYIYTVKKEHINGIGAIHGGVVTGVVDTAAAIAAFAFRGAWLTSTDLSVSFLKSTGGTKYLIHTDLTHIGGRIVNTLSAFSDLESGDVCATVISTYIVLGGGK